MNAKTISYTNKKTMGRRFSALILAFFCLASQTNADTLLLVHGMFDDGTGWRFSGASRALMEAGWRDAGHLSPVSISRLSESSGRQFYTLEMESWIPLSEQAEVLGRYLDALEARNPKERIILAGHSAGGVVSRLTMVQRKDAHIDTLITIASPHQGADTAALSLMGGMEPLVMLDSILGGRTFAGLGTLLQELSPGRPDSLLGWLNRQPHPVARYVAVVRESDNPMDGGDALVPKQSQDMDNVPVLHGRVKTIVVPGAHALTYEDGQLIAEILDSPWEI